MNIKKSSIQELLNHLLELRVTIFVVGVFLIYIFVAWRVNVLASVEPSEAAINTQVSAINSPHIDQEVVNKIRQLQDNSVNVQALFDQARKNPFQD